MSGHESTYEPKTGFTKWLDSRLPIVRLAHDSFVDFPTPKNLNYWYTFGGILAICLMIQIITGIVLAMHYEASIDGAFASVERIMRDVPYGWLLRYVHANGASFFFLAVYIHMFRGLYYGSYKAPREVLWLLGCVIFLLMIVTAFLGYMLPWGQMSYHGANVITGLIGALPLIGEPIQTWLMGGPSIGNATLQRFFSLHYLLPFVIAGVVILHIWALHVPGNNNPTGVEVQDVEKDTVPFHPYYTVKDGFAIAVFLVIFAVFVFYQPNVLGHADNYIEANPLVTPAHIVPEWYLLPFYAILRAITFDIGPIDAKLLGVLFMFASIAMLFLLPWMDTSKVKSMRYRPVARQFFFGFVACGVLLSWCGAANPDDPLIPMGKDKIEISYSEYGPEATQAFATEEAAIDFENGLAESVEIDRKKLADDQFVVTYKTLIADDSKRTFETWTDADAFRKNDLPANAIANQPVVVKAPAFRMVHLAQILTAYYFGYFFILMFLGLRETPKEEPASIHKSVLGKKAAAPVPAE